MSFFVGRSFGKRNAMTNMHRHTFLAVAGMTHSRMGAAANEDVKLHGRISSAALMLVVHRLRYDLGPTAFGLPLIRRLRLAQSRPPPPPWEQ